jgi:hypothetical protein
VLLEGYFNVFLAISSISITKESTIDFADWPSKKYVQSKIMSAESNPECSGE